MKEYCGKKFCKTSQLYLKEGCGADACGYARSRFGRSERPHEIFSLKGGISFSSSLISAVQIHSMFDVSIIASTILAQLCHSGCSSTCSWFFLSPWALLAVELVAGTTWQL